VDFNPWFHTGLFKHLLLLWISILGSSNMNAKALMFQRMFIYCSPIGEHAWLQTASFRSSTCLASPKLCQQGRALSLLVSLSSAYAKQGKLSMLLQNLGIPAGYNRHVSGIAPSPTPVAVSSRNANRQCSLRYRK
jgi:hypothetical protein